MTEPAGTMACFNAVNVSDDMLNVISLLGNDKLEGNMNTVIQGLASQLTKTDTDIRNNALDMLQCFLMTKYRLEISSVNKGIGRPTIDYQSILNICMTLLKDKQEDGSCVLKVTNVLEQTLLLMDFNSFCSYAETIALQSKLHLESFVSNKYLEENISHLNYNANVNIQILGIVLSVLLMKEKYLGSHLFTDVVVSNLLCCDDMQNLLLRLIMCNIGHISEDTLLYVIPKFIQYNKNDFLQHLWKHLMKSIETKEDSQLSHVFQVLCTVAEFYLPVKTHISHNVTVENDFWKLLQNGLIERNPFIRKQALYLMKRAVHILNSEKNVIKLQCSDPVFWWDISSSNTIWEQFFLIIETLEEKQVHIIKPVLPVLNSLVDHCLSPNDNGFMLHKSWILCVLTRIINHDNVGIVKWGISNFVQSFKKLQFLKCCIANFLGTFFTAINNSSLYVRNSMNDALSDVVKQLQFLFQSAAEFPDDDCQLFFNCVLDNIIEISWAPVPLFYVTYALASTPCISVWNNEKLKLVKNFIIEALRCQDVFIRSAVQCLFLDATIHLALKSLNIFVVADLLGSFRGDESLKRGTCEWYTSCEWLKRIFNKDDAVKFISITLSGSESGTEHMIDLSKKSVARFILLLCDAELLPYFVNNEACSLAKSLRIILSPFQNCEKRTYADGKILDNSLEMVNNLLKESQILNPDAVKVDIIRKTILDCVDSMLDQIFAWFNKKMLSVSHLQDYHQVNICIATLETFTVNLEALPHVAANVSKLQETAENVAATANAPPICRYFSLKSLAITSCCLTRYSKCKCSNGSCTLISKLENMVRNIVTDGNLNRTPVKKESDSHLTRDLQTLWGKLTSEYLEAKWSIVGNFLHSCRSSLDVVLNLRSSEFIVGDAAIALEIGGRNVLVPVMKVVEKILPKCMDSENTLKLISTFWNLTFELRKTELFWTAMRAFICVVFQPFTMTAVEYQNYLLQYAEKIFQQGQTIGGLCNLLISHLQCIITDTSVNLLDQKWEILINALIFGPVHRKDQRIITEACQYIASLGHKCATNILIPNDCYADSEVRMRGLELVLNICTGSKNQNIANKLMYALIEKEQLVSDGKVRYYNDSHLHRIKNRILQNLLVLEPLVDTEAVEKLLAWLRESMLKESQQPSIRYQQEWLIIRILLHHPSLKENLWAMFEEAQEKRPGSICSFIAIMYHLATALTDGTEEEFIDRSIQEILPLCMAQHFSIRLYAQTTLQKIFVMCKEQKHLNEVSRKYAVMQKCLQTSVDHGNAVKNAQKLQEDFYFSAFHPIEHYSLETIFYDLPRLANITQDEWIPLNIIRLSGVEKETHINLECSNVSLKEFNVAAWVLKSSGITEEDDGTPQNNFQKKLIPWQTMISEHELHPYVVEPKTKKGGLIVVASLIDRLPNLGGLSRTCEIFGVSEYVIGNLKYIEDKQFQNLSVTAEQWIPISEVKPHLLLKYLESKKKDGYMLIGAEQTANSISLNDVKFPQRTLLLLGNEKEGIPANLLPHLDKCVEIPQYGVVRSLNVHVTGALFVWEYVRQHSPT